MKAALGIAIFGLFAVAAACSSSTTDPTVSDAGTSSGTSGTSGTSGGTSGTSGGTSGTSGNTSGGFDSGIIGEFDFTFTGGGTSIMVTDFKVSPVYGGSCLPTGTKTCSFVGSKTDGASGCTFLLTVAFVGNPTQGASFGLSAEGNTPVGKGLVSYTEQCGATSKMWKATGGTLTLDGVTPPSKGFVTGMLTFSVAGATMAPASNGAGGATGNFTVAGKGSNIGYTDTNPGG